MTPYSTDALASAVRLHKQADKRAASIFRPRPPPIRREGTMHMTAKRRSSGTVNF